MNQGTSLININIQNSSTIINNKYHNIFKTTRANFILRMWKEEEDHNDKLYSLQI